MKNSLLEKPVRREEIDIPIIELCRVEKTYKTATSEFPALKGIDIKINQGEYVGIIGKSGAGKSTLVNMISGVDRLTSGDVIVGGVHVHRMNEDQRARWRGQTLGIVLQSFQLLPTLTLLDNIMLPMDFCNLYHPLESPQRALELLTQVELQDHANKRPSAISGGQHQRAAIARALANDPPIIIADEPTGSLDSVTAATVYQVFDSLVQQGKTVVVVTHDTSLTKRFSRTLIIADGEMINDWIVSLFPMVTHQQMLRLMHASEKRQVAPGETICTKDELEQGFFIVTGGKIYVKTTPLDSKKVSTECILLPGQYWGGQNLLGALKDTYQLNCTNDSHCEVLRISGELLLDIANESEEMGMAIVAGEQEILVKSAAVQMGR